LLEERRWRVTEKRDSGRLKTVTRIFIFDDPDGSIAKQLQNGASIERFIDKLKEMRTIEGNIFLNERARAR
jgi:hypothetical protein